jgi:hypothetical protein
MFAIEAVVDAAEGAEMSAPAGFDAACYRITGNVAGEPPYQGRLVHHGWRATRCEIPQWSGDRQASLIVAPVELQVE